MTPCAWLKSKIMKTIWKYQITATSSQTVELPSQYKVLSVQLQNGSPYIWCLVEPQSEKIPVTFSVFGTGHPMPGDFKGRFVGTFQIHNGLLVLHLFENTEPGTSIEEIDFQAVEAEK